MKVIAERFSALRKNYRGTFWSMLTLWGSFLNHYTTLLILQIIFMQTNLPLMSL